MPIQVPSGCLTETYKYINDKCTVVHVEKKFPFKKDMISFSSTFNLTSTINEVKQRSEEIFKAKIDEFISFFGKKYHFFEIGQNGIRIGKTDEEDNKVLIAWKNIKSIKGNFSSHNSLESHNSLGIDAEADSEKQMSRILKFIKRKEKRLNSVNFFADVCALGGGDLLAQKAETSLKEVKSLEVLLNELEKAMNEDTSPVDKIGYLISFKTNFKLTSQYSTVEANLILKAVNFHWQNILKLVEKFDKEIIENCFKKIDSYTSIQSEYGITDLEMDSMKLKQIFFQNSSFRDIFSYFLTDDMLHQEYEKCRLTLHDQLVNQSATICNYFSKSNTNKDLEIVKILEQRGNGYIELVMNKIFADPDLIAVFYSALKFVKAENGLFDYLLLSKIIQKDEMRICECIMKLSEQTPVQDLNVSYSFITALKTILIVKGDFVNFLSAYQKNEMGFCNFSKNTKITMKFLKQIQKHYPKEFTLIFHGIEDGIALAYMKEYRKSFLKNILIFPVNKIKKYISDIYSDSKSDHFIAFAKSLKELPSSESKTLFLKELFNQIESINLKVCLLLKMDLNDIVNILLRDELFLCQFFKFFNLIEDKIEFFEEQVKIAKACIEKDQTIIHKFPLELAKKLNDNL